MSLQVHAIALRIVGTLRSQRRRDGRAGRESRSRHPDLIAARRESCEPLTLSLQTHASALCITGTPLSQRRRDGRAGCKSESRLPDARREECKSLTLCRILLVRTVTRP